MNVNEPDKHTTIATVEKAVGAVSLSPCESENRSGRAKMQTAANTSLVLTGCSSKAVLADSEIVIDRGGLFRHIVTSHLAETIHSQELFVNLANELIRFAEQAYMVRNVDVLDEVSQVLMNLPSLFKTETGIPPGEYLRRLRMEKARCLLATSLLSVKQIMALTGYNNRNTFGGQFERSFDMTPSEYRRKERLVLIAKSGRPARNRKIV